MARAAPLAIAVALALTLLGAAAAGAFFGLFSCGGPAWHPGAAALLLLALALLASRRSGLLGLSVLLLAPGVFLLSEAAAASFYPSPAGSWGAFLDRFLATLSQGPC